MSDEGMDQKERADEGGGTEDVHAHSLDSMDSLDDVHAHSFDSMDSMDSMDAREEPPDVEGHQLGGAAAARPVD